MNAVLDALAQYFERVPDQVRKVKYLIWAVFILLTVGFFYAMGKATFDMTVEGWFEKDDPAIVAFDWFHDQFGSEDHLYLVYKAKDGDVFSEQSLAAVRGIRETLQAKIAELGPNDESKLAHIVEITTLENASVLTAKGDTLYSTDLVEGPIPTSAEARDRVYAIAQTQKEFPQLYYSKDRQYGGIMIETDFGAIRQTTKDTQPSSDAADVAAETADAFDMAFDSELVENLERPSFKPTEITDYLGLMAEVKTIINQPQFSDHLEYHPVGNTGTMEYNLEMLKEMGALNVGAMLLIALLLAILFRSISATVWSIVIVVLSVFWTIGIISLLGMAMTSFSMITIMLILTIGVANAIHIMSSYLIYVRHGENHQQALRKAYRKTGVACLLTSVTTMVAMLALATTAMVPVKIFGFMSALGVGITFIFALYLLPLMLDLWGPAKWQGKQKAQGQVGFFTRVAQQKLGGVLPLVERSPKTIIAVFLLVFIWCLAGSTKTVVDTNPLGQFPPDSPVRESFRIVDEKMMGTQSMEVYMDMGAIDAFHDPFVLNEIDQLQQTFKRKYGHIVVRTTSIVEIVKNANKTLHGENEQMYGLPESKSATSQTLFLFNNADSKTRSKQVSDNYDKAHIAIRFKNAGSSEYVKVFEQMKGDINQSLARLKTKYPNAQISITGMLTLMMQGAEYLTHAQLQSFALALVFVSVLLLLYFGSLKAGAISVLPNIIPAVLAFGILGWIGVPLDFNTMMIAPVIIGIAVDDTVHFLTHYKNQVQQDGDIRRALETTIKETGQAIVFTSIVLGVGFGLLGFSSSAGTANVGILGASAIFMGLLNDLFFLPAMILLFKLDFNRQTQAQTVPSAE